VAVNFGDLPQTMNVTIPAHAFNYLNLKEKTVQATDLLTGENQKLLLQRDATVGLLLPPLGAMVLKFKS
jgi:hypothetical protein